MKLNKTLVILSSVFIFFSCKTKKDEVLGKKLFYASDSFKILESVDVDKTSVIFSVDKKSARNGWLTVEDSVIFSAKYNEKVTTKICIQGLESGAQRTLMIDAKELNGVNSAWFGEHDGFDFFRKEKALVTYDVLGFGEVRTPDTIEIKGPQLYRGGRNFALPAWSFEQANENSEDKYDQQIGGDHFQPYGNGVPELGIFNVSKVVDINTPNGNIAYKLESSVTNKNGFLKMGVSFLGASFTRTVRYKYFITSDKPDDVYFNIYVYSPVSRPATRLVAVLGETDQNEILNTAAFLGKDASHDRFIHDRKLLNITMNFTGWKLFSFKYSDIPFATNKFYGGSGNKINEPQSVSLLDFNLEADFPGTHYAYVDFPIITYGGPFDPSILK